MRTVYYTISVIMLGVLQTTVLVGFGTKPLLLLALAVCVGITRGTLEGGAVGFASGLLFDILGSGTKGLNALLFMYIGILAGYYCTGFFKDRVTVALIFVAAASVAYAFMYYLVSFYIWGQVQVLSAFRSIMLPEIIYTVIATAPIFWAVVKMNHKLSQPRGGYYI